MHHRISDPRVQRTQGLLTNAFVSLMAERSYDDITIQNVIDTAGVSRATFYTHFDRKESLLASSVARLRDELTAGLDRTDIAENGTGAAYLQFALQFFRHVEVHRKIHSVNVGAVSSALVERNVHRVLTSVVRERLSRLCSTAGEKEHLEVRVQIVVGAVWSLALWWMHSRSPLSPEELFTQLVKMISPWTPRGSEER